jgi:hypothetical protein
VIAVVMSLAFYRFTITVADPDLWGHVKFSETMWKAGGTALPDPFSYLITGRLWFNHERLSEVIFYLVFAAAGPTGLILMKVSLGVGVMGACTGTSAATVSAPSEPASSSSPSRTFFSRP